MLGRAECAPGLGFLAVRWCGQPGSGASTHLPGLLQSFNYSCTPAMWFKIRNELETSILYVKHLSLGNVQGYSELISKIIV